MKCQLKIRYRYLLGSTYLMHVQVGVDAPAGQPVHNLLDGVRVGLIDLTFQGFESRPHHSQSCEVKLCSVHTSE